jgi:glycosyltransferase involved in cell wall biosynthesis
VRIVLIANTAWYIYNFRRNIIRQLIDLGHSVVAIGDVDVIYSKKISDIGAEYCAVKINGASVNPVVEFLTFLEIHRKVSFYNADMILSFTPKCNIYAGLSGVLSDKKVILNISGLGSSRLRVGVLPYLLKGLYRFISQRSAWVFFQNNDDLKEFQKWGALRSESYSRLPGSGVDLSYFEPQPPIRNSDGHIVFLFAARLLWQKGVGIYVEAARIIKAKYPSVEFRILGFFVDNPVIGVSKTQLGDWVSEGVVTYLGDTEDVRQFIACADCIVLPSFYGEGVPRVLLEAAASMRPIITANSVGCRDCIVDGISGFLCNPMDSHDLAEKMALFINLDEPSRILMGENGRKLVEASFSEEIVIKEYVRAIEKCVGTCG